VISPLLLNVALHGMETAAGARYGADGYARRGSPSSLAGRQRGVACRRR
jgi:hypothetical protein